MKYPEMLNKVNFIRDQLAFRIPRRISAYMIGEDKYSTFFCPSCNTPIARDFQSFCCSCGQALDWEGISFLGDE